MVYTYFVSGYALDFANGPYSAKAIALRIHAPWRSALSRARMIYLPPRLYFLKAANSIWDRRLWGRVLLALAIAGTALAIWRFRRYGILLLLWLPLPFYALSIAYGSVPIYMPVWYPFSYYNVRYGLELLPVFAVFLAVLAQFLLERCANAPGESRSGAIVIALVAASYVSVYAETPITLREAKRQLRGPYRAGTRRWRSVRADSRPRQRC